MQRLNVDQLKPGMYVVAVTAQSGSVEVTTQGFVRSQQAINNLKNRGVTEVMIDPSRVLFDDTAPTKEVATVPGVAALGIPLQNKVTFEQEIGRAATLYDEAKALQEKALTDLKAGRPIALEPMRSLANNMMESIFRNQDALLCVSRMREKDAYLLEHSVNVSILMTVFARHLKFDEKQIHTLATGALLHDIGKILVPDSILNKPGKLTPEEFAQMRAHVTHGVNVLRDTPGMDPIAIETVAQHHERLDGTGYPQQLAGDQISRAGRIIAIVDSYDAITAHRVYKAGVTSLKAFKILRDEPHAYDANLVAEFIRAIGMYPVGTLVKLKSDKIGMVVRSNASEPLSPVVKVFYHARLKQHITITDIDLAKKSDDEIDSAIMPEQFRLDLLGFFRNSIVSG